MSSLIIKNKKALHNYEVLDKLEAGIVLQGSEVKSLRDGKIQLGDAYARIQNGEVFLYNVHIAKFPNANRNNHEETRVRKLLLHRREIDRLTGKTQEAGLSIIPISFYWKSGRAKVELGVCRGKKMHDKREDQKKKDARREIDRAMKGNY